MRTLLISCIVLTGSFACAQEERPTLQGQQAPLSTKVGQTAELPLTLRQPDLKPIKIVKMSSAGGATLKRDPYDLSILASGTNPAKDTYVITIESDLPSIDGLRLEVLKHFSLPGGGPGRLSDGTFILTRVEITAAPKSGTQTANPVVVRNAVADFTQLGHSATNMIDGKPGPGWAIWKNGTANHRVDFHFEQPVAFKFGAKLTITLKHESPWTDGNLGRFRLSAISGFHDAFDPRAVVTKTDVEAVMGRAVDEPTMPNDNTCIYRSLPQHYNVEVSVLSKSTAKSFQTQRDTVAKVMKIDPVEKLGDEAYWIPNNYRVSVLVGNVQLEITTVLPVKEQTKAGQAAARVQRKEAAITLARKAIERIAKGP